MIRLLRLPFAAISIFSCMFSLSMQQGEHHHPQQVLNIIVKDDGNAYLGRDTIHIDDLSKELQARFWKSFMGTGKLQSAFTLTFSGNVLTGLKEVALNAIQSAQKNALNSICLEKFKQVYGNLTEQRKQKIEKQFPVLFQKITPN
jgi:hypothetical protein